MISACVLGCRGHTLNRDEAAFFRDIRPWGFILFGRNIDTPDQVRRLIETLRETVGRESAPILIDQEGGRVQRLGPPHWRRFPPGHAYLDAGVETARLGGRLIAEDLRALGINVNCAPVLDVPVTGAHDVIGDRAFSSSPHLVAALGRAMAEGFLAGGVLPIIKHIPGHGRARADSHHDLPVVDATLAELEANDFAPFRALADLPAAMTAHCVYAVVDPDQPCTTSPLVINSIIRGLIGFDGLLISDDLSMKALRGDLSARTQACLGAGCDIVLHCNGDLDEMREVAAGLRPLADRALERAQAALARIAEIPDHFDAQAACVRFNDSFALGRSI